VSPTAVAESAVDTQELYFENGLPGFPEARRFTLIRWGDEQSPFSIMRAVELEGLEFVVVPPIVFFPDYAPEVDDATVGRLELNTAEDALVLAVVTLGDKPADATANLMGPIVVNRHTNKAAQAVLAQSGYDLRTPLVAA
jgi:flagellar assembly factor FliW